MIDNTVATSEKNAKRRAQTARRDIGSSEKRSLAMSLTRS